MNKYARIATDGESNRQHRTVEIGPYDHRIALRMARFHTCFDPPLRKKKEAGSFRVVPSRLRNPRV